MHLRAVGERASNDCFGDILLKKVGDLRGRSHLYHPMGLTTCTRYLEVLMVMVTQNQLEY